MEVLGVALTVMVTSSLATHDPLVIVQRKTCVPAVVMPVTEVVGEEVLAIVAAGPLTWDQTPVPDDGVFAAMVALPVVPQMVWSAPALGSVGGVQGGVNV